MTFAKGSSGNPHGRPKSGAAFADALRMSLASKGPDGARKLRMIADALVAKAVDGDIAAIREIGDRLDGKPRQQADKGAERGPSIIIVSKADAKCV